jgi:hypothetical protein
MSDFPAIQTPPGERFSQRRYRAQVRTPFEGGAVQSRPQHTRSRYVFSLGWERLPTADLALLEAHFDANQGGTFNYTHPVTAAVHVVRYQGDELPEAVPRAGGRYWELDGLILEEK